MKLIIKYKDKIVKMELFIIKLMVNVMIAQNHVKHVIEMINVLHVKKILQWIIQLYQGMAFVYPSVIMIKEIQKLLIN